MTPLPPNISANGLAFLRTCIAGGELPLPTDSDSASGDASDSPIPDALTEAVEADETADLDDGEQKDRGL